MWEWNQTDIAGQKTDKYWDMNTLRKKNFP